MNSIKQQKASIILKSTYTSSEHEYQQQTANLEQQPGASKFGLDKLESKQMSEKVNYLNSKSINFNYGWTNLSVSVCKQTVNNEFQLNSANGCCA